MAIGKGTVSALYDGGKIATVKPYLGEVVTPNLTVHWSLVECLEVGMPVVYVAFEDNTGMVLARMDGEWNHKIFDGVEIVSGDLKTHAVPSYHGHTHTSPHGETSGPH